MADNSRTIKVGERFAQTAPTRICLVCDKLENPDATIADAGSAWLCPECKERIRKMTGTTAVVKKDCIERAPLLAKLKAEAINQMEFYADRHHPVVQAYADMYGMVERAEAVEAVRQKGEWVLPTNPYPWYKATCSCCGYEDPLSYGGEWNGVIWEPANNFCPNCGADMR